VDASTVASGAPGTFEQYDAALRFVARARPRRSRRAAASPSRRRPRTAPALLVIDSPTRHCHEHAEQAIPIVDALAALEPLHEGWPPAASSCWPPPVGSATPTRVVQHDPPLLVTSSASNPAPRARRVPRRARSRRADRVGPDGGEHRTAARARPAQLPAASRTHRRSDEIRPLCDYLSADARPGTGLTVAAVTGTEGWKTTLAVHVAHQIKSRFPDGSSSSTCAGGRRPAPVEQVLETVSWSR